MYLMFIVLAKLTDDHILEYSGASISLTPTTPYDTNFVFHSQPNSTNIEIFVWPVFHSTAGGCLKTESSKTYSFSRSNSNRVERNVIINIFQSIRLDFGSYKLVFAFMRLFIYVGIYT